MESCGLLMRFSFISIVCWMAAVLCAVLSTGRLCRWAGAGLPVVLAAGGTRGWVGTEVRAVCQPCPAVVRTSLTDLCGLRFSLVYRVGVCRLWVWLRGSETRSWCCNWTEVGSVRPPSRLWGGAPRRGAGPAIWFRVGVGEGAWAGGNPGPTVKATGRWEIVVWSLLYFIWSLI